MKLKLLLIPLAFIILFAGPLLAQSVTYTNNVGMQFVLIKPGSFIVGKFQPTVGKPEPGRKTLPPEMYEKAREMAKKDARRGFTVNIKKPYYIGKFEISQQQWQKVMGNNPSVFKNDSSANQPVENITWNDAQAFIKKTESDR